MLIFIFAGEESLLWFDRVIFFFDRPFSIFLPWVQFTGFASWIFRFYLQRTRPSNHICLRFMVASVLIWLVHWRIWFLVTLFSNGWPPFWLMESFKALDVTTIETLGFTSLAQNADNYGLIYHNYFSIDRPPERKTILVNITYALLEAFSQLEISMSTFVWVFKMFPRWRKMSTASTDCLWSNGINKICFYQKIMVDYPKTECKSL